MAEELLKKIPVERRWEITSKTLIRFIALRGDKTFAPELGKDEGIIAPVLGAEKWDEINDKVYGEGGKMFYSWVKEMFNMPVKSAIDADELRKVVVALAFGPDFENELVEKSPERIVYRNTKCAWWDMFEELGVHSEYRACDIADLKHQGEGLKAINRKIIYKFTKTRQEGWPYCEYVIEFKDE